MAEAPATPKPAAQKSEPRFIWITNNEDRVRILALKPLPQPASKTLSAPQQFVLPPGATIVERAMWEQWKKEDEAEAARLLTDPIPSDVHRARRAERAGQPFLVEGPKVSDKKLPLADLDETKARVLVPEIRDEAVLKQIASTERRGAVLEVVRAELEKMAKGLRQPSAA